MDAATHITKGYLQAYENADCVFFNLIAHFGILIWFSLFIFSVPVICDVHVASFSISRKLMVKVGLIISIMSILLYYCSSTNNRR